MKRFAVCLSVFVLSLFLLSVSALAKTPNRLEITNATVDLESNTIDIYGLNFGDDPEVWLADNESPLVVESSSDTQITASLPGDIQPGTYRLMVAMQGFDHSHPEKADSLDVTIGTVGPKGDKGDTGDQGIQGPKGDKGDTGDQGPKGDTGDTGAQGLKGDKGAQGLKGDKGAKGDKGDTGDQGPKGDKGDTGDIGPQGDTGHEGPQGPPGECDCPITQEQLDEIYAKIEYLDSLHRFTDMSDGTIRDNNTGLLWLKDANCFSTMNWDDAMDQAALLAEGQCNLTDGSVSGDWRLPTKGEWEAFYSTVYYNPALVNTIGYAQWSEGYAFTGVQSYHYWSSTEYDSDHAWGAYMNSGDMGYSSKDCYFYVWPVRSDN